MQTNEQPIVLQNKEYIWLLLVVYVRKYNGSSWEAGIPVVTGVYSSSGAATAIKIDGNKITDTSYILSIQSGDILTVKAGKRKYINFLC